MFNVSTSKVKYRANVQPKSPPYLAHYWIGSGFWRIILFTSRKNTRLGPPFTSINLSAGYVETTGNSAYTDVFFSGLHLLGQLQSLFLLISPLLLLRMVQYIRKSPPWRCPRRAYQKLRNRLLKRVGPNLPAIPSQAYIGLSWNAWKFRRP